MQSIIQTTRLVDAGLAVKQGQQFEHFYKLYVGKGGVLPEN